jgi:hypothetical protein
VPNPEPVIDEDDTADPAEPQLHVAPDPTTNGDEPDAADNGAEPT